MSQSLKVWEKEESLKDLKKRQATLQTQLDSLNVRIHELEKKTPTQEVGKNPFAVLLSGAAAGCCEILVTMPLDVIKTQMQVHPGKYSSIAACGRGVVESGGALGLYKGLPAMLLQVGGKVGLRFTVFDQIKRAFVDESGNVSAYGNLASGVLAGAVEASVWTTPMERIKVMQQTSMTRGGASAAQYASLLGTGRAIWRDQGPSGLYKGLVPTVFRQGISVGTRFALYGIIKDLLKAAQSSDDLQWWHPPTAGACVGALSICFNHPFDVVKSRVQAGSLPAGMGMLRCFSAVHQEEGLRAFSRGLLPRIVRVSCAQAIVFSVYDHLFAIISKMV